MRVRDDYRTLSGKDKASILLLSLGEQVATKLFALMSDEEIKEISQSMAGQGNVKFSMPTKQRQPLADIVPAETMARSTAVPEVSAGALHAKQASPPQLMPASFSSHTVLQQCSGCRHGPPQSVV